jgi:pre-mRNA-processing factor 19
MRKQRVISPTLTPIDVLKEFSHINTFPGIHQAARPGILTLDIHPVHEEITVSGGVDKTAVIFDVHAGKKLATLSGHKKQVTSVLFHTEERVITASTDTQIWIWEATSPYRTSYKPVHQITTHTGEVVQCSLHCLNEYLASASRDGTWAFHNLTRGQTLLQVPSPNRIPLTSIMAHPDGIILATGTDNNEIQIWDIKSQKKSG